MIKMTTLMATILFMCACSGIDDGRSVTTSYAVMPYSKLDVSQAIHVTVSDTAKHIYVTCGERIAKRVNVKYEYDELKIGLKPGTRSNGQVNVLIPSNALLREVDLSGASSFNCDDTLVGRELSFELSGASSLNVKIDVPECDIDLSGASHATVMGKATSVDLDLSGASTLEAIDLVADHVEASLSGASKSTITCNASLEVEASGASNFIYRGNPAQMVRTTGGSSVTAY